MVDFQYDKENNVYSIVFPILKAFQEEKNIKILFDNIPKYYCKCVVANEEAEKMELIAIQDITSLGYRILDKNMQFVDEQHMNLVFQILGRFHALLFGLKDQCIDKYKEAVNILGESIRTYCPVQLLENIFLAGLRAFDKETDADIINKLKKVKNVKEIFNNALEYLGPYKCIIHGDCHWPNNMLFKYKDSGKLEDMKLANFNMTKESTPITDLSLFFYSAASDNQLKKLDDYLETYYQGFSSFLKELGSDPDKMYPYEALKTEWKKYGIVGALLAINSWVSKSSAPKGSKKETGEKWQTEILKKHCDTAAFKKRARDIFLHLIEYEMM